MVKQTQTMSAFADELIESVWTFCGLALKGFHVKSLHDHFCMNLRRISIYGFGGVFHVKWQNPFISHWLRISRATAKLKVKFILCKVCHKNSNINWKVVDIYCWQEKSCPNGMHILLMFTIQGCCVTDYLISAIFFTSIL